VMIWLKRDLATLSTEGRPLSSAGNLETMYTTRQPLYKQFADCIVENTGDPDTVAANVMEAFHESTRH